MMHRMQSKLLWFTTDGRIARLVDEAREAYANDQFDVALKRIDAASWLHRAHNGSKPVSIHLLAVAMFVERYVTSDFVSYLDAALQLQKRARASWGYHFYNLAATCSCGEALAHLNRRADMKREYQDAIQQCDENSFELAYVYLEYGRSFMKLPMPDPMEAFNMLQKSLGILDKIATDACDVWHWSNAKRIARVKIIVGANMAIVNINMLTSPFAYANENEACRKFSLTQSLKELE